jgi:hypothetical protein
MTSKTVIPRCLRVYVERRAIASTDSEAHNMIRISTKPFGIFGNETLVNEIFNNEKGENLRRSAESFIENQFPLHAHYQNAIPMIVDPTQEVNRKVFYLNDDI